jgi:branched-chain amino acid transport system permease protein
MSGYFVDFIVLGAIYTLFSLGMTLSWGVLNVLNLAHGAIFMCGALIAYLITKDQGLSLWIVLPLAAIGSGLLALALELLAYRPIRRRVDDEGGAELAMLIASVGAGAMLVAAAQNITNNEIVAINEQTFTVERYDVLGLTVTNIEILIVIVSAALSIALAAFIARSRHGRALKAMAFDPYTCGLLGVSSDRLASVTMFVSGGLAGVAGVLLALHLSVVEAGMGDGLLLRAFAAIILGGIGSVGGAIAGAFILALAETITVGYISTDLRDAVAFALILLLLLLRPQGLFSRVQWQRA